MQRALATGDECVDNDECKNKMDKCSQNISSAKCLNQWGGYSCDCPQDQRLSTEVLKDFNFLFFSRYSGYKVEKQSCVDINECKSDSHQCSSKEPRGDCINLVGDYSCDCPKGYNESNHRCEDIDECRNSTNKCGDAQCKNTLGSYKCHCDPGFTLRSTSNGSIRCDDQNECQLELDQCDQYSECLNIQGGYRQR